MDVVKEWARAKGVCYGSKGAVPTHLLLNGGKLFVPPWEEDEFLEKYSKWLEEGRKLHVVEQKTSPCFRFFMDIDFVSRCPPTVADLTTLAEVIGVSVAKCAVRSDFHVSISNKFALSLKGKEGFKRGLHLVFDFPVNKGAALLIRRHVIRDLREAFGKDAWEEMVDASVYTGAGLRMIGSRKARRCGCKDGCRGCAFTRFIACEPVYEPLGAYASTYDMVVANSIRTNDTSSVYVVPYEEDDDEYADPICAAPVNGEVMVGTYDLEAAVRALFPECFQGGERVTKVLKVAEGYLVNASSRFCLNLGRNHASNNVFFYVSRGGVSQKCFCRCLTTEGRKQGQCRGFSCRRGPLPQTLVLSRFGPISHGRVAYGKGAEGDFRRLLAGVSTSLSSL